MDALHFDSRLATQHTVHVSTITAKFTQRRNYSMLAERGGDA